jgi:hypothetical protein
MVSAACAACCCCPQGLGAWASFAHQITNLPTPEVDSFVKAAIFATLTNVSTPSSCSYPAMPPSRLCLCAFLLGVEFVLTSPLRHASRLLTAPPALPPSHVLQVNFDAERFVDYITRADAFQQSIKTKLAQAGVQGRPSAAPLPWFDLQVRTFVVGLPWQQVIRAVLHGLVLALPCQGTQAVLCVLGGDNACTGLCICLLRADMCLARACDTHTQPLW